MVSQLYHKFTQPPSMLDARLDGEFKNLYTYIAGSLGLPLIIASGGTNSGTALNNNRVMKSAGGAIVEAAAITATRALISDANGIPTQSVTTSTELAFVNGVTSAIQTQLNAKEPTVTKGNLTDVGTDGIIVGNGTGSVIGTGTTIAQHVADSTHNGYLASADWSTFNGKQAAGNYVTALTGDVTATGPGSVAATLATVNASPGSTTISSVTTNAKGLVTANSSAATTGSGSVVLATGPTLSAPVLGTPASGTLTNCTGLPVGGVAAVAWATYTPTVTAQTGTITTSSASGRFQQIGKTVFITVTCTITTAGTGSGNLTLTLPVNSNTSISIQVLRGIEATTTGNDVRGLLTSGATMDIRDYKNAGVIVNAASVYLSGNYEAA